MRDFNLSELIIALSIANLLFSPVWRERIYYTAPVYHVKYFPTQIEYISLIVSVVFLAAVFAAAVRTARYFNNGKTPVSIKIIFLAIVLTALGIMGTVIIKTQFWIVTAIGRRTFLIASMLAAAAIFILAVVFYRKAFTVARTLMLIFSPFILVTFSQAVIKAVNASDLVEETSELQPFTVSSEPKPAIKARVVWLIFDELDYRAAFEIRPPDVRMPEFERLRAESVFASQAAPPANDTLDSIPSLLLGRKVVGPKTVGKNELHLRYADSGEQIEFGKTANVFSDVKQMGGDTALVGWYHPYCRVIGESLSGCLWETRDVWHDFPSEGFFGAVNKNFEVVFNSLPDAVRSKFGEDRRYISRHERMFDAALKVTQNQDVDLSLIQFTVPHYPYRYNRLKNDFSGGESYLDNLALTDNILGQIRRGLEEKGLWDETVVIVSSDHPLRMRRKDVLTPKDLEFTGGVQDTRVPFIVKLKNQKNNLNYDKPFNTVVTRELINLLMKGEISTPGEVAEWLDTKSEKN